MGLVEGVEAAPEPDPADNGTKTKPKL
jgi:hypothetical protein